MQSKKKTAAFSLVELVIVIVIIGVIAAIAVPRIGRGAKGAAESAVRANLAPRRNAIDLYAVEHGGKFPASDTGDDATDFVDQMTKKTDVNGAVGTDPTVHIYGPYLRKGLPPLPVGPNKGADSILIQTDGPTVNESSTTAGWAYNNVTGDIIANTDDADESGTAYNTY